MPIVPRRLFAASISFGYRNHTGTRRSRSPKSAFLERFGPPPSDEKLSRIQPSFPAWPDRSPLQPPPSRPAKYSFVQPPPNLLTPIDKAEERSTSEKTPDWSFTRRGKGELFSDIIGSFSELVKTASFEAKLAIQPAMEARRQQMLAAKNNLHRFSSLPPPVEYKIDQKERGTITRPAAQSQEYSSVTKSYNSPANTSKANSRTTRSLHTLPFGHRMLSTFSAEPSSLLISPRPPHQLADSWATIQPSTSSTTVCSWLEWFAWTLNPRSIYHSHLPPSTSSTLRRLYSNTPHFMYSNRVLSLFHPAIYASPAMVRGYATRRSPRDQIPPVANPRPQAAATTSTPTPPLPPSDDPKAPYILIPPPSTPNELCNALTHLIQATNPRTQVSRLISTHSQYPALHSAKSFNILLAYAARFAPNYSRLIFVQMRNSDIVWNPETQKLAVRAHIQTGEWLRAIALAERVWLPAGKAGPSTTPLDVFIELMHFAFTPKFTREETAEMAERCWKLFPTRPNASGSPRLAYNVVRLLVALGRIDQAIQLIKRFLESLSTVTPSSSRYCCAIIGLVVRPPEHSARRPRVQPAPSFHERLALFESLLGHNPNLGLVPDAKLTLCLLENLYRSRKRGSRAAHQLGELRAKYGSGVEDSAVRRLIARYAMYDGNLQLARAIHERELLARRHPTHASTECDRPHSRNIPWATDEPIPMKSHLEYIRKTGTENVKWTQLSRSLKRTEVAQGLVNTGKAREKRGCTPVRWRGPRRKREGPKRTIKMKKV